MYHNGRQNISKEEIQLREEYHRLSIIVRGKVVFWIFIVLMVVGTIDSYKKGQSMEYSTFGFFAIMLFSILKYAESRSKKIKAYLDEYYPIV